MARNPSIRISLDSSVPVVRQIADSLRVLLVEGKIGSGTTLPSIRRMAIELGVHFNTVAEAYRQLAAENWLELQHGRGAVVLPRVVSPVTDQAWVEEFRSRLRAMVAAMRSKGISATSIAAELNVMAKEVTRL
jgi:GntR family transcriptional regulator